MQNIGDIHADAPAARDNDMITQAALWKMHRLMIKRFHPAADERIERRREPWYKRRQQHGDNGHRQHQIVEFSGNGFRTDTNPAQNKRKFSNLRKAQSHGQRNDIAITKRPAQHGKDQGFAQHNQRNKQQYYLPMG